MMNAQENLAMEVAAEVKRKCMGGEVIKRKSMMKYEIKISTKTLDSGRVLAPKSWFEKLCRHVLPYKEIGWQDIGEVFYRYTLIKSSWFNVYLHQLDAPKWHPVGCHDHPWWFVTLLIKGGYLENNKGLLSRKYPGQILYRSADYTHDVTTPYGRSWSIVLTGPKSRNWGFMKCEG